MNLKLVIAAVALVISILVSALFSYKTYSTDFPCFYYVASTILDPQASNEDIYRYTEDTENRYSIPEKKEVKDTLLYSVPAAYLLAPLGLMPYYMAKATMIFLNMVACFKSRYYLGNRDCLPVVAIFSHHWICQYRCLHLISCSFGGFRRHKRASVSLRGIVCHLSLAQCSESRSCFPISCDYRDHYRVDYGIRKK